MAVNRKSYLFGVAPDQFIMILPDEYDDIASFLGATELTGAAPAGVQKESLKSVLASGRAFHIKISYLNGTKRKTAKLVCDRAHIGSGLGLVGKTFRGFKILGAVIPQHLTFG
ncbi:hypothetical protein [Nostoc sp.]|uniref:hypothetical protein n=1 Tax=Nostoc sp. TaxID=1180 RepID=UPI002FF581F6